ncbi:alpha/beta hydrolase [Herbiconiux sp. KACC 21604]|nr:alpha/beta hydrolase [Herbiconiux sp. KACC 21604]
MHGAMQEASSQRDLAELLAERHTVHLVDRRGHGASGALPHPGPPHTVREADDLRAVLEATGATSVFGVSSGAIIAARAALVGAPIDALALFEPPLVIDGSADLGALSAFDAAIERDDLPTAMGVAMKIAQMGPPWMFGLPLPVLAAASRRMLRSPVVAERARALVADFGVVRENADRVDDVAGVTARTLVLSGSATRPYLKRAATAVAERIPGAQHVVLPGEWHSVTQNRGERGRPTASRRCCSTSSRAEPRSTRAG